MLCLTGSLNQAFDDGMPSHAIFIDFGNAVGQVP